MKTICSLATKAPNVLSVCLLALLIGCATIVQAQERVQISGYFLTVAPRGEFSENVTNNGYGAGLQGLVRVGSSPFLVGGDLGFVGYGSESHREIVSATISDFQVRVRTTNNIFLPHFVLRAQPRTGWVRPYVDGLVGLKYLWTSTSISDVDSDETISSDTNLSDTSFSYGIGGGLQIPFTKNRESKVVLDTGVRYLRGGRAAYLRKGSIHAENGSVVYDVFSSRTDVLAIQVGVMFRF
jgi:opacity protein-like surface antigen